VRRLLAAITSPLVFRLPGHDARKLFSFAATEQASSLDLRMAAASSPCVRRRALYLRHALDEVRHAEMFLRASTELRRHRGLPPLGPLRADSSELFARLGELRFLAFIHRGESRGRRQFEAYRDYFARRGETKLAATFEAIIADERTHESYSRELLVELAGSERLARRALRSVWLWETLRLWHRAGKAVTGRVYAVAMMIVYLATLAPLALLVRFARPQRRGWALPARERESASPPVAVVRRSP
jgi:rubrerythrin